MDGGGDSQGQNDINESFFPGGQVALEGRLVDCFETELQIG